MLAVAPGAAGALWCLRRRWLIKATGEDLRPFQTAFGPKPWTLADRSFSTATAFPSRSPMTIPGMSTTGWPLHEIPTLLQEAFLASEDRRFYRHHGVRLAGQGPCPGAEYRGPASRARGEHDHRAGGAHPPSPAAHPVVPLAGRHRGGAAGKAVLKDRDPRVLSQSGTLCQAAAGCPAGRTAPFRPRSRYPEHRRKC